MQLEHSFTVPVGIDDAWKVLLDIEQVAPCMPGAALETVEGDDFTGSVKVKLGPIALTYKGRASFVEKDESAHRASIDAQGKDSRGGGTAGAKVTATLAAEGPASTRVDVLTDLNITGKPAQFGRGVMVDVGNKLIGQFADNLAAQLSADNGSASAPATAPATAPAKVASATKTAPAKASAAKATAAVKATTPAEASVPAKASAPKASAAKAAPAEASVPAETTAAVKATKAAPAKKSAADTTDASTPAKAVAPTKAPAATPLRRPPHRCRTGSSRRRTSSRST